MCYECAEAFLNIEDLPKFEEWGLESKRGHGFEFSDGKISRVHRSKIAKCGSIARVPASEIQNSRGGPKKGHTHSHGGHVHTHEHGDHTHSHGGDDHGHSPGGHGRLNDRRAGNRSHDVIPDGSGEYVPLEAEVEHSAPEPQYQIIDIEDYDDLVEAATNIIELPRIPNRARPGAGYGMVDGEYDYDRVLMVVDDAYDPDTYNAVADALRRKGMKIDIITLENYSGKLHTWHDDLPGAQVGIPKGKILPLVGLRGIRWWEDVAEKEDGPLEYDMLIYGITAGALNLKDTRYERIPWRTKQDLANPGMWEFPNELWDLINQKTTAIVKEAKKVHLTDPEGTDLEFTNYDDEGYLTPRGIPGHILGHPTYLTDECDTSGVIAGTLNHAGAFPRIEAELKGGKVVDVQGGGEFGEFWREFLDMTEGIYYPAMPHDGMFWLWEVAIGTHPKIARPVQNDLSYVPFPEMERRRSGVIHCGMGLPYDIEPLVARRWDGDEEELPWGHVHIHLNFPTYKAKMPNGDTFTLIEDGHLTILDDPEVRELASEYGDPDELLSIDWVPAVPGINTDGDYNEDYAQNPRDWIDNEMADVAEANGLEWPNRNFT